MTKPNPRIRLLPRSYGLHGYLSVTTQKPEQGIDNIFSLEHNDSVYLYKSGYPLYKNGKLIYVGKGARIKANRRSERGARFRCYGCKQRKTERYAIVELASSVHAICLPCYIRCEGAIDREANPRIRRQQ